MDKISFLCGDGDNSEIMRITADEVWVNPNVSTNEIAKAVIDALEIYIKSLIQQQIEKERDACAQIADASSSYPYSSYGEAIRARGNV